MEKTIYTTSSSAEREAALRCIDALADDAAAMADLYCFAETLKNRHIEQPAAIHRE